MVTRGRKKSVVEPAPPTRDLRDVKTIERLQQRIQELELQQLRLDLPAEEAKTKPNIWNDEPVDVNPFGGENPNPAVIAGARVLGSAVAAFQSS
nr:F-box domain, galactose oxidase, beta-propeller [Tanacetum cinerariifolium]